jgi:acetylglutamate kinase
VVAPLSLGKLKGKLTLLNINGDTAAGEIAAALAAQKLIFLTDVEGIHDGSGKLVSRLNAAEAKEMLTHSTASGGMFPKIEASLKALRATPLVRIINGKTPHALLNEMKNGIGGTSIVPE